MWCVTVLKHQQQVLGAIERAKQVTPPEMNSIIRVRIEEECMCLFVHALCTSGWWTSINALFFFSFQTVKIKKCLSQVSKTTKAD